MNSCTNRVVMVNTWNSLSNWVVSANTTNTFKTRLDKFGHKQDVIYMISGHSCKEPEVVGGSFATPKVPCDCLKSVSTSSRLILMAVAWHFGRLERMA